LQYIALYVQFGLLGSFYADFENSCIAKEEEEIKKDFETTITSRILKKPMI
jgi:hypothetical protein